jgi:hypothetical protein
LFGGEEAEAFRRAQNAAQGELMEAEEMARLFLVDLAFAASEPISASAPASRRNSISPMVFMPLAWAVSAVRAAPIMSAAMVGMSSTGAFMASPPRSERASWPTPAG